MEPAAIDRQLCALISATDLHGAKFQKSPFAVGLV